MSVFPTHLEVRSSTKRQLAGACRPVVESLEGRIFLSASDLDLSFSVARVFNP